MSAVKERLDELSSRLDSLKGYRSDGDFNAECLPDPPNFSMANFIVACNIPVVPNAKVQKLTEFVSRIYSQIGKHADNGVTLPTDADGNTAGYAFVEFVSPEDASKAVAQTNNWDFDKAHKLTVLRFDVYQQMVAASNSTQTKSEVMTELADPYYWLKDSASRDQILIRTREKEKDSEGIEKDAQNTRIDWVSPKESVHFIKAPINQLHVYWSPQGTYLVSLHPSGVAIRQSDSNELTSILRLSHPGVRSILWSPNEQYLCTSSESSASRGVFIIWDVLTGEQIRSIPQKDLSQNAIDFQWSADSMYLTRIEKQILDENTTNDLIKVFSAPHFGLLDNRSIRTNSARDLSVSPTVPNFISYWTPEQANAPASLTIMKLPSKETVRTRSMQSASDLKFFWHPAGNYLAVVYEKSNKTKVKKAPSSKPLAANEYVVEIFRLNNKSVPMETLTISESLSHFAWDPKKPRFSLAVFNATQRKNSINFYDVPESAGNPPVLSFSIDDPRTTNLTVPNTVLWAPNGEYAVVYHHGQSSCSYVLFIDVERKRSFNTEITEVDLFTTVQWSPSSTYLALVKSQSLLTKPAARDMVGNGVFYYSFQGKKMFSNTYDHLYQFSFRPYPIFVEKKDIEEIEKNLNSIIEKYTTEDWKISNRLHVIKLCKARIEREKFRKLVAERSAEYKSQQAARISAGLERPITADYYYDDTPFEVVLKESTTVVKKSDLPVS